MNVVLFSDREDSKKCISYLREKKIPILFMVSNTLKSSDFTIEVRKNIFEKNYKNSVLLSYYYGSLIKKEVFSRFQQAVNFHPAPLPYYRGVKCGVHAIIQREKKFGVTCHRITEKFDEGEVLGELEFPLDKNETGYSINIKSRKKLFTLFKRYVNRYILKKNARMFETLDAHQYRVVSPTYFSNKDFENLKCLDGLRLDTVSTKNILKAMWHPKYRDTYYTDSTKKKVYITYQQ